MTLAEKQDALILEIARKRKEPRWTRADVKEVYKQARLQALRDAFPLNPGGVALLIAETEAL